MADGDSPTLPNLTATGLEAVARLLKITDHTTGARVEWAPTIEQRAYWEASCAHRFVFITKPRQVGISTAASLVDGLWTWACDKAGHRVCTGIVVDVQPKTFKQVALVADFLAQLGIKHDHIAGRITFPNGSTIEGITAAADAVGRSGSYQRIRWTELPYYSSPLKTYNELMQSLSLDGHSEIETTMDIRDPTAKNLFQSPNSYHKVFLPLEMHLEYRAPADDITPEQEERLRGEGFTNREAMAWFLWAVDNKCGGDEVRAFREYPQKPEHMFQSAAGRWVQATPTIVKPLGTLAVEGVNGDSWAIQVFRRLADCSRQLVLAIDTATGKEQDRCAVGIIDKREGDVVASLVSDTITIDDLARVSFALWNAYTHTPPPVFAGAKVPPTVRPAVLVEGNGIGAATVQACRTLGMSVIEVTTTEASRYEGLLNAKRWAEKPGRTGPAELAEECDDLHRDDLGRFKGKKDFLMMVGFALNHMRTNPYRAAPVKPDPNVANFADELAREYEQSRSGW